MSHQVSGGLESLKLTNDELGRLQKAFGDPEFRKLFKEYAEEISDPENRKRYEEEIRTMELEQGMDVEFVNPLPGHCLKTRHWPSLLCQDVSEIIISSEDNLSLESTKVFINVCKSDKVGCPVMKPLKNSSGKAIPNGFYWSLPHCFTPPHEDFDKNKNRAMVYDVAFHPKAFELATTSAAMRRLLNVTAVEGIQRQFNLCLGKTPQQALHLVQLIKSASEPFSRPVDPNSTEEPTPQPGNNLNRNEIVAREEAILRAVHTLKGTAYKGMARPTVIRRRRDDYERRQAELKRRTDEELQACTDPVQRETISKLSNFPPSSSSVSSVNTKSGPIRPTYSITYSSDFDMLNCRDAPDVNPIRPPDRIRVSVKLPGLVSSSSVDLELTTTNLSLTSEKPVAYELDLKLPYEVEDSKGVAQFNKSTSILEVTVPLKKKPEVDQVDRNQLTAKPLVTPTSENEPPISNESPLVDSAGPSSADSIALSESRAKKKRRKRNRRRHSSASDTSNDSGAPASSTDNQVPVSDQTLILSDQLPISQDVCPTKSTEPTDQFQPVATSMKSPKTESHSSSETLTYSIPMTQVGLQQLIVSKDRRLAPVRFRQDASSVSIVFSVRGILPESFVLHWASPSLPTMKVPTDNDEDSALSVEERDENVLLLLFNFASRGTGGCTMDWGVVVRCPSTWATDSNAMDFCRKGFRSTQPLKEQQLTEIDHTDKTDLGTEKNRHSTDFRFPTASCPPRVISADFSTANAVIVLAKPSSDHLTDSGVTGLITDNKSRDLRWWFSVATGRTLNAGMQECPFEGVEGCLLRAHQSSQPVGEMANDAHTPVPLDDRITSFGHLRVNTLCSECCEIVWSRNEPNLHGSDTLVSTAVSSTTRKMLKTGAAAPAYNVGPRPRRGNTGFSIPPTLKGILKQRSYSESSGDEQLTPSSALRFAGLADTWADPTLSFDEFPTASSSELDEPSSSESRKLMPVSSTIRDFPLHKSKLEGMRRCVSNEKLVSSTAVGDTYPLAIGRQRRRSVNFSAHDQRVDYYPRDTVETLHHTLLSRRKKARRRETRRRNLSGEYSTSATNNWFGRKCAKRNPAEPKPTHFSGNNSLGEAFSSTKTSNDPRSSKPYSLDDTGDHPSPSESSSSSPLQTEQQDSELPTMLSNNDHVDCSKPTSESVVATESGTPSELNVRENQTLNSATQLSCPVTLCAAPLFELDED